MNNDPLFNKVMSDYGQYLSSHVPSHQANLAAYEEALKNKPAIKKEQGFTNDPLYYLGDGKWWENTIGSGYSVRTPDGKPSQPLNREAPEDPNQQIFDNMRAASGGSGRVSMDPKDWHEIPGPREYSYDPRQYMWDEYGKNLGMKPQLFGGSLGGLSMAGVIKDPFGVGTSIKGAFAQGGHVPAHEMNLAAYEEALKNKPAIKQEEYYFKDYPLYYTGQGKWMEIPKNSGVFTIAVDESGKGSKDASGNYINATPLNEGRTPTAPNPGDVLEYTYDPRQYEWDKYGRQGAAKPQLFGGSLGGLSMAGMSGMGNDVFNTGSALKGAFAQGGMVKGYARGTEDGPIDEEELMAMQAPTMAPNFMPMQTGQVEPTGGGYVPMAEPVMAAPVATAAPTMPASNSAALNAMLAQYTSDVDYSPELKQARADRRASEAAFGKTLDQIMTSSDEGPSKAEMYFRLAAAFGTPGKTGHFSEGLAQAAGALGDYSKEQRASKTTKRKLASEVALKKQELALESAKDTEKTLLGLQSEANKDRREFIKAQVKELIDSGKPQSTAGKAAKDEGLTPGTPEFETRVSELIKLDLEKTVVALNAQLQSGKIALANLGIQQEKAAREAIKLEPDERKAIRDDEDAMFAAKATIKNMNTALNFVDDAFTNTAADQAAYKKLKQTNPNDPRVKATEELENLIGLNVVGSLKTTFGGNPTEGERRALQELGGLGTANKEVRKAILKRAAKALEEAADYRSARITKIETGGYRKKTEEK